MPLSDRLNPLMPLPPPLSGVCGEVAAGVCGVRRGAGDGCGEGAGERVATGSGERGRGEAAAPC